MNNFQNFIVEDESKGLRVDKYLSTQLPKISRTKIKRLIESGNLKINNIEITEPKHYVKNGDSVDLKVRSEETDQSFESKKDNAEVLKEAKSSITSSVENRIADRIVYEDQYLIILDKPAKLLVHPGAGRKNQRTLTNHLLQYSKGSLSTLGGESRPGIVHRLDMETSGLMVVAKDDIVHALLAKMFESHTITRKYIAFCKGQPVPKVGKLKLNVRKAQNDKTRMVICDEDHGRISITNYKVLKSYMDGKFSMIEFSLETGRTHQIRVHMEYKKTPIIGDKVYGKRFSFNLATYEELNKYVRNFPRHALHSYYINFEHPMTNEALEFESKLPEDLLDLEKELIEHSKR